MIIFNARHHVVGLKEVVNLSKHAGCWLLWVSPTQTWSSPTSEFFLAIVKICENVKIPTLLSCFPVQAEVVWSRTRQKQMHWSMFLAKGYSTLPSPCFCLHWLTPSILYATRPAQVLSICCSLVSHVLVGSPTSSFQFCLPSFTCTG